MELKPDFAFTPLPPIRRPLRFATAGRANSPLGLLEDLKGTWTGIGFNLIWRPFHGGPPTQDRFLELNLTRETLCFEEIPGAIPNRGLLQSDINMFGLRYLQTISDANIKNEAGNPAGLHFETGVWKTVPQTEHPQEVPTFVRMASIGHGATVLAQGVGFLSSEGPFIPAININPFVIGKPASLMTFPEANLSNPSQFRTPPQGLVGIDQAIVDNPNLVLQRALEGNFVKSTVVFDLSSDTSTPVFGGGLANTAFLQGSPTEGPNAQAVHLRATFWIEIVQDREGGPDVEQLQYSQTILLNFHGLSWPHINVATLRKHSDAAARVKSFAVRYPEQAEAEARHIQVVLAEREAREKAAFKRNIKDAFRVRSLEWQNVSLFEDGNYDFATQVNVLLGRNGFGKTLLLRTLVAMLQHNAQYSTLLFPKDRGSDPPLLRLTVERNGKSEETLRDLTYFGIPPGKELVGKIPILAIPDSRFLDRSQVTVAGAAIEAEGFVAEGARNFLTQEPFVNIIEGFLTGLCLDYWQTKRTRNRRRRFERGIFKFVEEVVGELTEDRTFQFAEINRVGRTHFEILVRTTDTQDLKIPIQTASQGTLSVVAIFGLIYSFLGSLRPNEAEDKVSLVPAIVVIDEIDAHLHPSWQQKILGMLTSRFPNVQFIISAHSPAIVAGCDQNEVSVLRKRLETGRFYVETLPEDFLGATAQDLYGRIFQIEDADRLYLEFTAKSLQPPDRREREIELLEKNLQRSTQDEARLEELLRESRLVDRAEQARNQRLKLTRSQTQFAMLDAELARLRQQVKEQEAEIKRLKNQTPDTQREGDGGATIS
jgi:energy-coupling factor transporter ATP-binding protein EcfA2